MTSMASKVALFWMNLNFLWWTFTFAWKIELLKKPTGPDDSLCRRALMTRGGKGKKWPWIRVHVAPAINHHFISMNYSLAKLPTRNDSPVSAVLSSWFKPSLTQYFECQTPAFGFVFCLLENSICMGLCKLRNVKKNKKNESRFVHHFFSVRKCD